MSTTTNRNHTLHFRLTFDDGEVIQEKCRNSFGGWVNLVKRVEARFGGRMRSETKGADTGRWVVGGQLVEGWELTDNWVEGGRRLTITELVQVAPGMFAEVA